MSAKEGDPKHCSLCFKRWREAGAPMPESMLQELLEKHDLPVGAEALQEAYVAGQRSVPDKSEESKP